MQGHPLSNVRSQGVRTPMNQSTEQAPAMQVTNVSRMEAILVEWGNERGQKETSVAFVINGKVYVPPQYGTWTEGFRPLVDALGKQVVERLELSATGSPVGPMVPTQDDVDITGDTAGIVHAFEQNAKAGK